MPQSLLTGQLQEKLTYRVRCLYSSFVHVSLHKAFKAVGSVTIWVPFYRYRLVPAKEILLIPIPHRPDDAGQSGIPAFK